MVSREGEDSRRRLAARLTRGRRAPGPQHPPLVVAHSRDAQLLIAMACGLLTM